LNTSFTLKVKIVGSQKYKDNQWRNIIKNEFQTTKGKNGPKEK
jgi:hypothetical protein